MLCQLEQGAKNVTDSRRMVNIDNALTLAFCICSAEVWRRKGSYSKARAKADCLGGDEEAPAARLLLPLDASAPTSAKPGTDSAA